MNYQYLFSVCLALFATIQLTLSMGTDYTPQNTQFAFDFHGVVVKAASNRISSALLSTNFIYRIHFNRCLPALLWAFTTLAYTGGTGEQYIKLLTQYQQPDMAQMALDIANNQQPIPKTIDIIKQIKGLGYEVNMASDIGDLVLKDFERREQDKPIQEQILPLFVHKHHVNYLETDAPIHKPDPAYYAAYLQQYNQNLKPYVIFIDDKLKNVVGARNAGMIGILFTSAAQLKEQLVKMGILTQQ